tara:strand:- start:3630 stop:3908 length:279 start_codon:yes stop_codon:yes gene_type:complete
MCKKTILYKELTEKYLNGEHTIELEKADGTLTDATITLQFTKEPPLVEQYKLDEEIAENLSPDKVALGENKPREVAPGEVAREEYPEVEDAP